MRMRGHSEHDDHKYVPKEILEKWGKQDPIERYQAYLFGKSLLTEDTLKQLEDRINAEIDAAVEKADASPEPEPRTAAEGVYANE